jgi:Ca2+-binding RTX toxin-like protein
VLTSTGDDAVLANTGQHVITVSGKIMSHDDGINTIGCEAAQTVIIQASGIIRSGFDKVIDDSDGVILDGIGSTLINHGIIQSHGSGLSLFVRDAGTTTITNHGLINAEKFGVWNKFGLGVLNFTNTGVIESPLAAFFGGAGVDNLTNRGIFRGNVELNNGNDVYIGLGGLVTGTIHGGGGNDRFVLGNGADKVDGGFGVDLLDFSAVTTNLVIDLANASNNAGAPAKLDVYTNIENVNGGTKSDTLRGNGDNNTLKGNGGTDRLEGAGGEDTLIGGNGGDTLIGGAGRDVFLFNTVGELRDVITDFSTTEDVVRFEGSSFGFGSFAGGLDATRFHSGLTNAAGDALDRFIFRTTDATLWYDRDGTGAQVALLVADLNNGILLTAANIDFI